MARELPLTTDQKLATQRRDLAGVVYVLSGTLLSRVSGQTFTDDQINVLTDVVGHGVRGWTSGDGPYRLWNRGGSLPSGLSNSVDYYIEVVPAGDGGVAFHLTEAEAIAGGSGTRVNIISASGGGVSHIGGVADAPINWATRTFSGALGQSEEYIGLPADITRGQRFLPDAGAENPPIKIPCYNLQFGGADSLVSAFDDDIYAFEGAEVSLRVGYLKPGQEAGDLTESDWLFLVKDGFLGGPQGVSLDGFTVDLFNRGAQRNRVFRQVMSRVVSGTAGPTFVPENRVEDQVHGWPFDTSSITDLTGMSRYFCRPTNVRTIAGAVDKKFHGEPYPVLVGNPSSWWKPIPIEQGVRGYTTSAFEEGDTSIEFSVITDGEERCSATYSGADFGNGDISDPASEDYRVGGTAEVSGIWPWFKKVAHGGFVYSTLNADSVSGSVFQIHRNLPLYQIDNAQTSYDSVSGIVRMRLTSGLRADIPRGAFVQEQPFYRAPEWISNHRQLKLFVWLSSINGGLPVGDKIQNHGTPGFGGVTTNNLLSGNAGWLFPDGRIRNADPRLWAFDNIATALRKAHRPHGLWPTTISEADLSLCGGEEAIGPISGIKDAYYIGSGNLTTPGGYHVGVANYLPDVCPNHPPDNAPLGVPGDVLKAPMLTTVTGIRSDYRLFLEEMPGVAAGPRATTAAYVEASGMQHNGASTLALTNLYPSDYFDETYDGPSYPPQYRTPGEARAIVPCWFDPGGDVTIADQPEFTSNSTAQLTSWLNYPTGGTGVDNANARDGNPATEATLALGISITLTFNAPPSPFLSGDATNTTKSVLHVISRGSVRYRQNGGLFTVYGTSTGSAIQTYRFSQAVQQALDQSVQCTGEGTGGGTVEVWWEFDASRTDSSASTRTQDVVLESSFSVSGSVMEYADLVVRKFPSTVFAPHGNVFLNRTFPQAKDNEMYAPEDANYQPVTVGPSVTLVHVGRLSPPYAFAGQALNGLDYVPYGTPLFTRENDPDDPGYAPNYGAFGAGSATNQGSYTQVPRPTNVMAHLQSHFLNAEFGSIHDINIDSYNVAAAKFAEHDIRLGFVITKKLNSWTELERDIALQTRSRMFYGPSGHEIVVMDDPVTFAASGAVQEFNLPGTPAANCVQQGPMMERTRVDEVVNTLRAEFDEDYLNTDGNAMRGEATAQNDNSVEMFGVRRPLSHPGGTYSFWAHSHFKSHPTYNATTSVSGILQHYADRAAFASTRFNFETAWIAHGVERGSPVRVRYRVARGERGEVPDTTLFRNVMAEVEEIRVSPINGERFSVRCRAVTTPTVGLEPLIYTWAELFYTETQDWADRLDVGDDWTTEWSVR
jgi:hypothetical protein